MNQTQTQSSSEKNQICPINDLQEKNPNMPINPILPKKPILRKNLQIASQIVFFFFFFWWHTIN